MIKGPGGHTGFTNDQTWVYSYDDKLSRRCTGDINGVHLNQYNFERYLLKQET